MGRPENKLNPPHARPARGLRAILICLLPLLCGGCAWFQTWQDSFNTAPDTAAVQAAPLPVTEVPVRMLYPHEIQTVDQAVSYMLEPHSYHPGPRSPAGELLAKRRFINNFSPEPVPLRIAMQRLMGPDGQIVLDAHNKEYAYRMRTENEPGVVLADLALNVEDRDDDVDISAIDQKLPANPPADADTNKDDVSPATWRNIDPIPANAKPAAVNETEGCRSIQFSNRGMLSATVREYFLNCGFDEVSWRLGEPGRYADYRLMQNVTVPLPGGHEDLIKLLHARFGIRTLIHDNNQVEFHDEDNTM